MISFFSTLKIGQRIMLGFALLLSISFITAAFNISRLSDLKYRFDRVKRVSNNTYLTLKIDNNISELQRYILVFSQTGSLAAMTQLKATHNQLLVDTNSLAKEKAITSKIEQTQTYQLKESVATFAEKIQSLQKQYYFRNDLINAKLASSYSQINEMLEKLITSSEQLDDKRFLSTLWYASKSISEAEVLATRYFNNRQFEVKQQSIKSLSTALDQLKSAQPKINDRNVQAILGKTIQLINQTKLTFYQAVQADRDYLFLINIVIAGNTAELRHLANALKAYSLTEQQSLAIATEKRIKATQQIALYTSLFSALLAIVIAVLMGRNISLPLVQIASTFSKLIEGKVVNEVPGIDRKDEIGNLAKAANIFRQNNAKTKQLLKQSEMDKQNLIRRERDLEKTNENLNHFTSIASHDLKSPIRGIHDLADWIQEDLGENIPETVKHNLARIQQRIEKMEQLIEDLLQYSRAGKISTENVLIHPIELVKEIVDFQDIPDNFHVSVTGNANAFYSAKTPLQTSIRNILANAIKHHDQTTGHIEIKVYEKNHCCVFEIMDDGPGIPKAAQERIFMLFHSLARDKESTGLGLAYSKRMIEAHDGRIEVVSNDDTRGSVFRIWWPLNNNKLTTIHEQ